MAVLKKDKNFNEKAMHERLYDVMNLIHFSDEELIDIEKRGHTELNTINEQRNNELDDLHRQKKRILSDLSYLSQEGLTLMRTGAMSPQKLRGKEIALKNELEDVNKKTAAHDATAQEMLQYVLMFPNSQKTLASTLNRLLIRKKDA